MSSTLFPPVGVPRRPVALAVVNGVVDGSITLLETRTAPELFGSLFFFRLSCFLLL